MRKRFLLVLLVVALGLAGPALAGGLVSGPWPTSSDRPVEPCPHPSLAERAEELAADLDRGFRLVVFGDQRALADGEWQAMNQLIRAREDRERHELPLLGVIDTGDIVDDGSHTDQFHMLTDILSPLRGWPYVVGIGNHEVDNNRPGPARRHTVEYLGGMIGDLPDQAEEFALRENRLYYRVDVGGVRILSLDTNDLVYGPEGDRADDPGLTYRGRNQLRWLVEQLEDDRGAHTTVVLCHHPFVHSSRKHRGQARKMWSLRYGGRTLPEILAVHDVDLVLVGHTHTYERFRLTHRDGGSFQVMNISGRPRNSFAWFGADARRARDIAGVERDYFADAGWTGLDVWSIEQLDAMIGEEENQWAEVRITPGGVEAEVFFLVDEGAGGVRRGDAFVIE